jgi:hypothetical protein
VILDIVSIPKRIATKHKKMTMWQKVIVIKRSNTEDVSNDGFLSLRKQISSFGIFANHWHYV